MRSIKIHEGIGIGLILIVGIVHIYTAPDEFKEAPYLGIMFVGAFIGSIIAAIGIFKKNFLWGWGVGALIAFGSCAGYLLSRTIGLPISGVEPWGPGIGYLSLMLEILFLVMFTWVKDLKQFFAKISQRSSTKE